MGDIHKSFVTAYADMDNPKKNAANPAFRSKYANLEEVLSVIRPLLAAVGLAITQEPVSEDGRIGVWTRIHDAEGDCIDFGAFTVPLTKNDAQGAGSAITYCRRYALTSIFGLAQEDDDGNAASKPQVRHTPNAQPTPEPEPAAKPTPAVEGTKVPEEGTDDAASAGQIRKIWAEANKRGWHENQVKAATLKYHSKADPTQLTKKEAMLFIDRMTSADLKSDAEKMAETKAALEAMGATEVAE